jgi:hypothetical protein
VVSREEVLYDLVTERYSKPVREWKPTTRRAPLATQLEWLRDGDLVTLDVVAEAS